MSPSSRLLAVIPARGRSKGLPGKNTRPFLGLPLIAHTIMFARLCPEIDRCIISTDSAEIADVAKRYAADVPFMRPAELASDEAEMWPVLRHALDYVERQESRPYDFLALLDPTSPGREPSDVATGLERLLQTPDADGIIGVSEPDFNPIWHCVVERDGWMADLMEEGSNFERRQEVPPVYRINGSLYIWRTGFLRSEPTSWRRMGKHLIHQIPEARAMSFDTLAEFQRAQVLVKSGLIQFPWLAGVESHVE
jgi:N-acylneuraminate cytidylyltransferase